MERVRTIAEELAWKEVLRGLDPPIIVELAAAKEALVWETLMAVGDVTSNEVGSGARFNDGKVRYDLIPTHLLESTANVLEYGAKKYAPWNWAKGMQYSVVIGCIKRHTAAIERGEDVDPETGQRHTGHLMANLLFLEHYMNMYPEMDDRPKEWFNKKERDDERGYTEAVKSDIGKQLSSKYHDSVVQRGIPDVREDVRTSLGDYIIYATPDGYNDGAVAGYNRSYPHRF